MNTAHSNPASKATAYRVARRTERANRIAEQWADSLGRYWECRTEGASVLWVKVEGHKGWWLLNDAAAYAMLRVEEEIAEAKGECELLGIDTDEVAAVEGAPADGSFTPDFEEVGFLSLVRALEGLRGPNYYEAHEAA